VLGSYSTGLGVGAAEIVTYDKASRRLFLINAAATTRLETLVIDGSVRILPAGSRANLLCCD
jgi:hypothetical protein